MIRPRISHFSQFNCPPPFIAILLSSTFTTLPSLFPLLPSPPTIKPGNYPILETRFFCHPPCSTLHSESQCAIFVAGCRCLINSSEQRIELYWCSSSYIFERCYNRPVRARRLIHWQNIFTTFPLHWFRRYVNVNLGFANGWSLKRR